MTIREALQWGTSKLYQKSASPSLDSLILLSHILETTQTYLIAYSERLLSAKHLQVFQDYIDTRSHQEPIAYITGSCEFWSLQFTVNSNCLIPRPDTELLIEKILAFQELSVNQTVLELGTGSGIIAIILALEKPAWAITATDISETALEVAQKNALRFGATVHYKCGSWFQAVPQGRRFHHIISNPPYLANQDEHLKTSLRYEPQSALVSGPTGLEDLAQLIQQTRFYLKTNGCLWLEQGYDQAKPVKEMMIQYGYTDIKQYKDLSGIIRVSKGCYQQPM